jgi:hypothetical protein
MAHEAILPAIRALLVADGAGPDFADGVVALVRGNSARATVPAAARLLGVSPRTAWAWIQRAGVATEPRRGRAGTLVDVAALRAASPHA